MSDDSKSDPRDYVVDISSLKKSAEPEMTGTTPSRGDGILNILFKCCNVYAKIRRVADGSAFAGHCPKCARGIRIEIDPNSTNTGRFFTAE